MENIVLEWLITYTKTDLMKKLRSGKLIGEIVRVMRDKMDEKLKPDKKIFAYFSHEQTLIDFFHTLGMKNIFKPGYGAAAFIELHKIKGEHYVKVCNLSIHFFWFKKNIFIYLFIMKILIFLS